MNRLFIIGNLTKDPELRATPGGAKVCNFSVAVNKGSGDNRTTEYFRVAAWNQLGENCQKYLSKGKKVAVMGEVSVSAYTSNQGQSVGQLEVTARDVEFLSAAGEERGKANGAGAPAAKFTAVENEEEMPF